MISANISQWKNGPTDEILFIVELKSISRNQLICVILSTNEPTIMIEVWDVPIGLLSDRPISTASVNRKYARSANKIPPMDWQIISLERFAKTNYCRIKFFVISIGMKMKLRFLRTEKQLLERKLEISILIIPHFI